MKTLYVSDLDGTLLTPEGRVSPKTAEILNELIQRGLLISVDTARSIMGISIINLWDIHFPLPLILMNGALLYDMTAGRIEDARLMSAQTVGEVIRLCREHGKEPLLYHVEGNHISVSYTNPTCRWNGNSSGNAAAASAVFSGRRRITTCPLRQFIFLPRTPMTS